MHIIKVKGAVTIVMSHTFYLILSSSLYHTEDFLSSDRIQQSINIKVCSF